MLWSAVMSAPSEVGGEIPSARLRGRSAFETCARGLGDPPYITVQICWELREHVVISHWFGIVGSPSQLRFPWWLQRKEGSLPASFTTDGGAAFAEGFSLLLFQRTETSYQCCTVVDHPF